MAGAVVAGARAGLAGVYGIGGFMRNAGDPGCRPAVEVPRRVGPFARAEVAAMVVTESPLRMPDISFRDPAGGGRRVSDWRRRPGRADPWADLRLPCLQQAPR